MKTHLFTIHFVVTVLFALVIFPAQGLLAQTTSPFTVHISVGVDTVMAGDTAQLGIRLTNESTVVSGGQFIISASPANKVNFVDIATTSRTTGWSVADSISGSGRLVLFYSGSGDSIDIGSGDILTVSYTLTANALPRDTISVSLSTVELADGNINSLNYTLQSGRILVGECALPCDVTADGTVNIYDLLFLVQYALGILTPNALQFDCADPNGDSQINNIDIVLCIDIILSGGTMLASAGPALSTQESRTLFDGLTELKVNPAKVEQLSSALSAAGNLAQLPKAFTLEQNSPNPFNPSTTIRFSVPEGREVQVRLDVFDLRGRLVVNLVDGLRGAGAHSVFWDGTDNQGRRTASGVYFYRLTAGDFVQTRKMIILK